MKGVPYHVEFVTWNTRRGKGEGIAPVFDSMHYGQNFGHASVEIAMPFNETTAEWVEQYCKRIKLHRPKASSARFDGEQYTVDVPVYYTTKEGQLVYDPKSFQNANPHAEIVTHVYLSWVPGDNAPQRDERDPFGGLWKQGFELYTHEQDKQMEHEGHYVPFQRGYQGIQQIEISEGEIEGTEQLITRGVHQILHHLTDEEKTYYAMLPEHRERIKRLLPLYGTIPDESKNNESITNALEILDYISGLKGGVQEKYAEFERYRADNQLIAKIFSAYCATHDTQAPDFWAIFLDTGISEQREALFLMYDEWPHLEACCYEEMMDRFLPSVAILEQDEVALLALEQKIDSILARNFSEARKNPLYIALFSAAKRGNPDLELLTYHRSGQVKDDLKSYLSIRDKLKDRIKRHSQGMSPDSRILLPIADISEIDYKGHPEGLDVLSMLKQIPQIVADGEGYALKYKNCSDIAQEFGYYGAPTHLKDEFRRTALGLAATPQMVENSASHYANIIYDRNHIPGEFKHSAFHSKYLNLEREVAALSRRYFELEVKAQAQDALIEEFVNCVQKDEYFKNQLSENLKYTVSKLRKGILSNKALMKKYLEQDKDKYDFKDLKKLTKEQLKTIILEYANQQYRKNIQEDAVKLDGMIDADTGLYSSMKAEGILSDQKIKAKMQGLYANVYPGFTLRMSRRIDDDFKNKGTLYRRACHTLMYENALGTENLTDPNFVSIQAERAEMNGLKLKMGWGIFKLLRMRIAKNFFTTSYNVDDPWYEYRFAKEQTRGLIDRYIGKDSSWKKRFANTFRFVYLGYAALRQNVLIAPRRGIANGWRWLTQRFTTSKSLEAASKEQQFMDTRFAIRIGKSPEMIKERMAIRYVASLPFWKRLFTSNRAIADWVEAEFLAKSEYYNTALSDLDLPGQGTPELGSLEAEAERTQREIGRIKSVEESVLKTGGLAHCIDNREPLKALQTFSVALREGKIPYFEKHANEAILSSIRKVDDFLIMQDQKLEKILSASLINSIEQFQRASMQLLGNEEDCDSDEYFKYDPTIHEPIIPPDILKSQNVAEVRAFLKQRNENIKASMKREFLNVDKLSDTQVMALIRYMGTATHMNEYKRFEKNITLENVQGIIPYHKTKFILFLNQYGLDLEFIDKVEQSNRLEALYVKLLYDVLSNQSALSLAEKFKKPLESLSEHVPELEQVAEEPVPVIVQSPFVPEEPELSEEQIQNRNRASQHIRKELCETEKTFLTGLKHLANFRSHEGKLLVDIINSKKYPSLHKLLSSIPAIVSTSETYVELLEQGHVEGFEDLAFQIEPIFKMHCAHIMNYTALYDQAIKEHKKFIDTKLGAKIDQEFSGKVEHQGKNIEAHLITPVQRTPRYALLAKELIKNVLPASPALEIYNDWLRIAQNYSARANETIRRGTIQKPVSRKGRTH